MMLAFARSSKGSCEACETCLELYTKPIVGRANARDAILHGFTCKGAYTGELCVHHIYICFIFSLLLTVSPKSNCTTIHASELYEALGVLDIRLLTDIYGFFAASCSVRGSEKLEV